MIYTGIFFVIAASAAVRGHNDCVQRTFGPNAIVCVCNSTYCDSTPDLQVGENEYITYTSTRSGERLQTSVANFSSEPIPIDILLTVDRKRVFQTIFGFGGAMTDAAAINIKSLSNATQQNLIESYYGAEGNRYIFCRIPIASTDFSTRLYSYDEVAGDTALRYFSLVEEDEYKIYYLHKIKSVMSDPDRLKIFTTSWSAPVWMKEANVSWSPLKSEYYQVYANYILKFFNAYKERGIDIWGMTPGNEPLSVLFPLIRVYFMIWGPFTAAIFTANYLAPTLSEAGYNPVYMALDDQRFEIPWYSQMVFENEKARQLFNGTAVHWYADSFTSVLQLDELQHLYPDKFILLTEACNRKSSLSDGLSFGSWEQGEKYMSDIIQNLSHWVTGWVDWNLVLDEEGGPTWTDNYVNSPIIVMPQYDEFFKQPMYYALQHVSKFVLPNSKRISLTGLQNISEVNAIAFVTPKENVVIVIMNKDDKPYNITIQDKITPNNLIHLQLPEKSFITLQYQAQ